MPSEASKRKQRAASEPIYFHTHAIVSDNIHQVSVFGTKRDSYNVSFYSEVEENKDSKEEMQLNIKCTCMDFKLRHMSCKHIYYVVLKYLQTNLSDLDYCEGDDIANCFGNTEKISRIYEFNRLLWNKLGQKYQTSLQFQKEISSAQHASKFENAPRPVDVDEDCIICFDPLIQKNTRLLYCANQCLKSVHEDCWHKWNVQERKKSDKKTSCVFCRCPMTADMVVPNPQDLVRIEID